MWMCIYTLSITYIVNINSELTCLNVFFFSNILICSIRIKKNQASQQSMVFYSFSLVSRIMRWEHLTIIYPKKKNYVLFKLDGRKIKIYRLWHKSEYILHKYFSFEKLWDYDCIRLLGNEKEILGLKIWLSPLPFL